MSADAAKTTSTTGTPMPGQEAAIASLRSVMKTQGNQAGWDHAWNSNVTPWENELGPVPQPALVSTCEKDERTRDLIPKGGKAIVPGCGRGQDVEFLAKRGFQSTGIDISSKAVERAQEWLSKVPAQESHSRISFVQTDYFALADETGRGQQQPLLENVDLIYDYTFFCAIPPELHSKWAAAHAAALKPGGKLLCLVFPLRPDGNDSKDGPPYFVTPELYKSLLSDQFELEYLGIPLEQAPSKTGKEKIMIWRKK